MNTEKENNILPDEELELIGRFARKKLSRDELYTFSLILCDNEIDRDNEKFTVESLHKLAELFVGKTGIFDHNMKSKDQTARIYAAQVLTDETRKTADGEIYTYILAKAYTVRTEKNKDLIAEIDAGIKKETSVGCSVKEIKCSICGKDIKTQGCEHRKGKVYGGKLCCYLLNDPADAYEWSFVAVPAQKNAGIVKSFDPSRESDDLAEIAKEIRQELEDGIIRCAATVIPEMKGEAIEEICNSLSLKSLREMHNAFRENAQKSLPVVRQLDGGENKTDGENSVYKI
ncbi:MAG: hypothetical protein U0M02_14575 [Acutalibacteraceae bacterium]|nr:hypothetical protein [Acutalibacteraceae bacterium]